MITNDGIRNNVQEVSAHYLKTI